MTTPEAEERRPVPITGSALYAGTIPAATERTPPATAIEVLAALENRVDRPTASTILASYFAPGPEPRYDTPARRAEAEAEAEI